MDLREKTNSELVNSMIAETAKSLHEARCAASDLEKAMTRMKFNLVVLNILAERFKDET